MYLYLCTEHWLNRLLSTKKKSKNVLINVEIFIMKFSLVNEIFFNILKDKIEINFCDYRRLFIRHSYFGQEITRPILRSGCGNCMPGVTCE